MSISDVGRNDPCPCGSGAKYKHCCLREEKRRDDARASRRSEAASSASSTGTGKTRDASGPNSTGATEPAHPEYEDHDPETCPNCRLDRLVGDTMQTDDDADELERDINRLLMLPQSAMDAYRRAYGRQTRTDLANPSPAAVLHLELGFDGPDGDERPAAAQFFSYYTVFGDDRLGGSRTRIRHQIRSPLFFHDSGEQELYDAVRNGRFFVVETEGGRPAEIDPVTGLRDDEAIDVIELIDPEGGTVVGEGLYAGWLLEWRDLPFVFFATRLPETAADKMRDAADNHQWGETRDEFRRIDYEADVLTAICAPGAEVVDRPEGRALRGPDFDADVLGPPTAVRHVFARFDEIGAPAGDEEIPWPFALAEATDAEDVDCLRDAVDWLIEPDAEGPATSSTQMPVDELRMSSYVRNALDEAGIESLGELASLTPVEVLDIRNIGPSALDQIEACLDRNGLELGGDTHETDDERTDRFACYFDGDDFLDWIGLGTDGSLDHPRLDGWRDHPVEVLDVPASFVAERDLHEDWSVAYALEDGAESLDDTAEGRLRDAAEHHRVRLRWIAVLELWSQPTEYRAGGLDRPLGRPTLRHYLAGLRRYFADDLAERPVEELPEPASAGFKSRLTRNLDHTGDTLRVSDLPESREALESVSGIGEATADATYEAVEQMIHDWPGDLDAGGPDVEQRRRASEKVAEGIDELGDLFE